MTAPATILYVPPADRPDVLAPSVAERAAPSPNQFTAQRAATCVVPGCDGRHLAKGYCQAHYQRWVKYGDATKAPRLDTEGRFFSFVNRSETGCWLWLGGIRNGYGAFSARGKSVSAHRFSYETFVAPIPDGFEVDHLCRNPACVRPDHLEAVTPGENTRRAVPYWPDRRIPVCKRGHPLDGPDSDVRDEADKSRSCRVCLRARKKARYAAVLSVTHHAAGCGRKTLSARAVDWQFVTCTICLTARIGSALVLA